jgi:PAS domain S-box-containing protein
MSKKTDRTKQMPPGVPAANQSENPAASRENEDRFRELTDALPIVVWTAAPDGSITFVSDYWRRYSGVDFRGTPAWSTVHPDDREGTVAKWLAAVRAEVPFENEARHQSRDGEYRWFLTRGVPMRDAAGKVTSFVGTMTDIHDHKLTEDALQKSEERFQLATEAVVGFFYDWDVVNDRVVYFGGTEQVFGFSLDEVPGSEWWISRIHPEDAPSVKEKTRRHLEGDARHFTQKYRFLHKDGHYLHIVSTGRIVRDASGRAIRLLGGITDISERRGLELERERLLSTVQWERTRLREIFDAAPSFIALTRGPDHVFEYVNEAYYRFAGRRDLIGRPMYDVFPEGRPQRYPAIRERVLREGITFVGTEMLVQRRSADGRTMEDRFVDLTLLPFTEPDGTRSGIVLHGIDVTAHVHARREMERLLAESERVLAESEGAILLEHQARAAAETAMRQRDHVLDVVAHELGSPLSTIAICARVLAIGDAASAAETLATVDLIERCVGSMQRLIRDLSDVASIETGRLALDRRAEAPATLLAAATEMFAARAKSAGVEFETRVIPGLPAVSADAGRVVQVIGNLLSNALRHTASGGRVRLCARRDPAGVRFAVKDTGPGIAAEDVPHVFDRFWHTRSSALRGGGLGLPIVRGIVEAHGGSVELTSTSSEGTIISFTIPTAS